MKNIAIAHFSLCVDANVIVRARIEGGGEHTQLAVDGERKIFSVRTQILLKFTASVSKVKLSVFNYSTYTPGNMTYDAMRLPSISLGKLPTMSP